MTNKKIEKDFEKSKPRTWKCQTGQSAELKRLVALARAKRMEALSDAEDQVRVKCHVPVVRAWSERYKMPKQHEWKQSIDVGGAVDADWI